MKKNNDENEELKNLGQNREKVVGDIAKEDNKIDDETAAINEEQKVVDIYYVLENNSELAFKINNILKLGFGMDYIENLVALQSDFTVGDDVSVLESELEKVFNMLVETISEEQNGIVLNIDGTIDEKRSELQKAKIATYSDVTAQSYILTKESQQKNFEKTNSTRKINDSDIENFMLRQGETLHVVDLKKYNKQNKDYRRVSPSALQADSEAFKTKVNEKKEKIYSSLESRIKNIDEEYIDKNNDVTVNAIWYNKKISELNSMGYKSYAKQLETEFENKFNGSNLYEKVQEIKVNMSQQISDSLNKGKTPESDDIRRATLGENGNIFVETFGMVGRKVNKLQNFNGKNILDDFYKSSQDNKYTQQQIANLYSRFYESRDVKGTQIIRNFILEHKDDFEDFFNDEGKFSFNNTIQFADKFTDDIEPIYKKMQKGIGNASKYGKKQNESAEKVYSFITSDKNHTDKEKYEVKYAMKMLIKNSIASKELKNTFKKKNHEIYKEVDQTFTQRNKDTWKDISTTIIKKGKKAITHLPGLLSGKESVSEYSYKVSESFNEINGRVGNKINRAFRKIAKSRKQKRIRKTLASSKKVKALPPGKEKRIDIVTRTTELQTREDENSQANAFNDSVKVENADGKVEKAAIISFKQGKESDEVVTIQEVSEGQVQE